MINHYSEASKLSEVVQHHAMHIGNKTAYIFLKDGENEEVRITYKKLDQKARAFAANLLRIAKPGERALLLYPSGLEYIIAFIGCLYAGIIAAPTTVPHLKRATPRLNAMVEDAQATIACTDRDLYNNVQEILDDFPALKKLHWVINEDVNDSLSQEYQEPNIISSDICFLQYTSGSTSLPKGVMISHSNLISTLIDLKTRVKIDDDFVFTSWLPIFHDMGLILMLLTSLYGGGLSIFMSPVAFLEKPIRWLKSVQNYKANFIVAPNFAFDLCNQKISEEEINTLDLSSLKVIGNAAEPVRLETIYSFIEKFSRCGINLQMVLPSYGLAESTVMVSTNPQGSGFKYCTLDPEEFKKNKLIFLQDGTPNGYISVGCGWHAIPADFRIVNPHTKIECAPDEIGEIWIQSGSVAKGYWGKAKETEEIFHAYITNTNDGPYLRTGDMGFIYQENLHITGRIKDMVIVQGKNFYPQDIEITVEKAHEGIRPNCGTAFAIESSEGEKLVIIQEVKREYRKNVDEFEKMGNAIRIDVAKYHGLRVNSIMLIMPSTISKTTSGKIQRNAMKEAFVNGKIEPLYEWHAPDKK